MLINSSRNYMQLKRKQTDPTTEGILFDFMQNLLLPQIPIQDTFYLRQLSASVFNAHGLQSGRTRFYHYHEGKYD